MIYLLFAGGYYFIFLLLLWGLIRTKNLKAHATEFKASVIICGRNEENRLPSLLNSLEKIDYPADNYEIILVNDSSTDKTGELMQQFCNKASNRKYLYHEKNTESYKGKKGALDFGIQNSRYEFIMATDADCIVPKNWLKSMLACFDENTAMVQGYSPVIKRRDFLSVYQQFDTLAEGVTAAASMFFNNPTHANARNFAFRKSIYNEVGGFSSISHVDTGDDFYLAKLIKAGTPYKFRYNPDRSAFVTTLEVKDYRTYWHQQLRRNSKGFDLSPQFFVMGSWLLIFHLLLIMLLIEKNLPLFFVLAGIKLSLEFLTVLAGVFKFGEKRVLLYFLVLWFLYPVFYFSSQLLGSFRFYRWK